MEGANHEVNKHLRFEAGDGNGTPRGVRLSIAGAAATVTGLLTIGGFIVGAVRLLDPQVTERKIEAVQAEARANEARIEANMNATQAVRTEQIANISKRLDGLEVGQQRILDKIDDVNKALRR